MVLFSRHAFVWFTRTSSLLLEKIKALRECNGYLGFSRQERSMPHRGGRGLHAISEGRDLAIDLAAVFGQVKPLVVLMKHVCHGSNNVNDNHDAIQAYGGDDCPFTEPSGEVIGLPTRELNSQSFTLAGGADLTGRIREQDDRGLGFRAWLPRSDKAVLDAGRLLHRGFISA